MTKTGKHEKIAGYDCEDWDIKEAGGRGRIIPRLLQTRGERHGAKNQRQKRAQHQAAH